MLWLFTYEKYIVPRLIRHWNSYDSIEYLSYYRNKQYDDYKANKFTQSVRTISDTFVNYNYTTSYHKVDCRWSKLTSYNERYTYLHITNIFCQSIHSTFRLRFYYFRQSKSVRFNIAPIMIILTRTQVIDVAGRIGILWICKRWTPLCCQYLERKQRIGMKKILMRITMQLMMFARRWQT
jgi:hypothetical protein